MVSGTECLVLPFSGGGQNRRGDAEPWARRKLPKGLMEAPGLLKALVVASGAQRQLVSSASQHTEADPPVGDRATGLVLYHGCDWSDMLTSSWSI